MLSTTSRNNKTRVLLFLSIIIVVFFILLLILLIILFSVPPTNDPLNSNDLVSHSKSHFLVSPIKSSNDRFKCTGNCICVDTHRRSASGILAKNVIHFVTAVSSFAAFIMAKYKFDEDCTSRFEDSCSQIIARVEDCVQATPEEEESLSKKEDESTGDSKLEKISIEKFECVGRCRPVSQRNLFERMWENRDNEEMTVPIEKDTIDLYRPNYDYIEEQCRKKFTCEEMVHKEKIEALKDSEGYRTGDVPSQLVTTRNKFVDEHLHTHCVYNTVSSIIVPNKWGQDLDHSFVCCHGFDMYGKNEDVECKPVINEIED